VLSRFAPSPTGDLHLGGAFAALANYVFSTSMLIRIDDLDVPRVVPGSASRILDDLAWLGLHDNQLVHYQSRRIAVYESAFEELNKLGLLYACDCSRSELSAAVSAPHAGEELVYPGHCAAKSSARVMRKPPAWRVRVSEREVVFEDAISGGPIRQHLRQGAGDFVVKRADAMFAYHFASAIDDADMQIDLVLRGNDLQLATPRQVWLQSILGYPHTPTYGHLPMVVDDAGERLQKRAPKRTVRELRERGLAAAAVVSALAAAMGIEGAHDSAADLRSRVQQQGAQAALRAHSGLWPGSQVAAPTFLRS
jgi:glutamyl/glutaminyl-tRNA synthetase